VSERGAVVLIGFMGAGKTTTARDLAALRGLHAQDADQLIEARAGRAVA
jgi:shikimate kinase/3-dehydroquinate synthase